MLKDCQVSYCSTVVTVDERSSADQARAPRKTAHAVQFYSDDAQLISRVAQFLKPAFDADEGVLVVATKPHRAHLRSLLLERDIDVGSAEASGRFVALDARATLESFLRDGRPDPDLFEKSVGSALDRVLANAAHVRVYGEMVSLLWMRGDPRAALALEHLWNEASARRPFTLLCGYPARVFADAANREVVAAIASAHSRVAPVEGFGVRV